MKNCQHCGAENAEDAVFCSRCGEKFTAEAENQSREREAAASQAETKAVKYDWKKITGLVGLICLGVAALVSLIFVFCTGCDAVTYETGSGSTSVTQYLYEYFGKAYENADAAKEAGGNTAATFFTVNIMGTVISAVGLLTVVIMAGFTAYRAVKKFVGKKDCDIVKPAVLTYLAYAAFETAFLGYHASSVGSVGAKMYVAYNGATVAGLVIASIGFALYLISRAVLSLAEDRSAKNIAEKSFGVGIIVLLSIAIGLIAGSVVNITLVNQISGYSIKTEVGTGFMVLLTSALQSAAESEQFMSLWYACFVGAVVEVALICSFARFLYIYVMNEEDKPKTQLIRSVVSLLVLSVAYLAAAVVAYGFYEEVMGIKGADGVSVGYGMPIGVLVVTVLAIAAMIGKKPLVGKIVAATVKPAEAAAPAEEVPAVGTGIAEQEAAATDAGSEESAEQSDAPAVSEDQPQE